MTQTIYAFGQVSHLLLNTKLGKN